MSDNLTEILQASDLFEVVEKVVQDELAEIVKFPVEFFDFFEIDEVKGVA